MKKRLLLSLSLLLTAVLAFGVGMGTVAYFTSEATSENNVFTTGTLKIGVPEEGANEGFISADLLQPGDTVTKTLNVVNLGNLPYKYKVSAEKSSGDQSLYEKLNVVVSKGDSNIYSGPLADLIDEEVSTDVDAGETETLTFAVTLPTDADNDYQGLSSEVKFIFDATQTNNPGWDE